MGFKEFLLKGIKVIRTSLGLPVPVEDLLGGFLSLVEKLDQLGENEVFYNDEMKKKLGLE